MGVQTPLLNKIQKGKMIVFQSAEADLTFAYDSFRLSKYALLNLPPIVTSVNNQNTIQFANIEGAFDNGLSTDTPPPNGDITDLSQSLQNYLLNFESLLLNSDNFDTSDKETVAEKVFFKWLKEIGAVRFRNSVNTETASILSGNRFVEEDENSNNGQGDLYDRVIKYLGNIDMEGGNRIKSSVTREYSIYVPLDHGNTPVVLLKSQANKNYVPQLSLSPKTNTDYIVGKVIADDPSNIGLTVKAFYDMDLPSNILTYNVNGGSNPMWFDYIKQNGPKAYFTEQTFGDVGNDLVIRTSNTNSITFKRSKLDGVSIDWNTKNYKFFEQNTNLKVFGDYNQSGASNSFNFNAVALYYDIVDSNGNISATNLYGVLFLNDVVNTSGNGSQIQPLIKIKPQSLTSTQGNGYGIKISLKTIGNDNQQEIQVYVNEYSNFSMHLFTEMMQKMSLVHGKYEDALLKVNAIVQEFDNLENLILNSANAQTILQQISDIKDQISDVVPNSNLADLIQKNTLSINNILKGNTSIGLSFFLDFVTKGGLKANLVNNKLYLDNTRQRYNNVIATTLNTLITNGVTKKNSFKLAEYDNLLCHKNQNGLIVASSDIYIYIDDSTIQWKNNQSYKIIIGDEIDFNGNGIIIYTDSLNRQNNVSNYGILVGSFPQSGITDKKPIIEIICIDEVNLKFLTTIK